MNNITILVFLLLGVFACKKVEKPKPETYEDDLPSTLHNAVVKSLPPHDYLQYVDTAYTYPLSQGQSIIIENSFPKGGVIYTDSYGKEYVYAVFWTRILNNTDSLIEYSLAFPEDMVELPSSRDNSFKIRLPNDVMTLDKAAEFNYGLADLDFSLDHAALPPQMQGTISAGDAYMFYVAVLFDHGVDGVVRSRLSLKGQKLLYNVNGKEIHCGQVSIPKQY